MEVEDSPLFNSDLRIEVSEAIHLHRRDIRFLMSERQYENFTKGVIEAFGVWDGKLADKDSILDNSSIPGNELLSGRWAIEELEGDTIHFHYGDVRIEMTHKRFQRLLKLFKEAGEKYYDIQDDKT